MDLKVSNKKQAFTANYTLKNVNKHSSNARKLALAKLHHIKYTSASEKFYSLGIMMDNGVYSAKKAMSISVKLIAKMFYEKLLSVYNFYSRKRV